MKKLQLLGVGGFLVGSYTTFHGHRLGKDCWLCQYRGIGWIIAITGIIYNDYLEKQEKESTKINHYFTNSSSYSQGDVDWENRSDAGSEVSDDSTDTVKNNKPEDNSAEAKLPTTARRRYK